MFGRTFPSIAGLIVILLFGGISSCTDASLREKSEKPPPKADNLLRVEGQYCTEERKDVAFPVKVLFVLDQSASLQFTDGGKKRHEALRNALGKLGSQQNVEFAFIGFSSWIRSSVTKDVRFINNQSKVENMLIGSTQGLGPGTDYQGALSTALRVIETDIQEASPAERTRTRYVINFISDGSPDPRCNKGCEDGIIDPTTGGDCTPNGNTCVDGVDNDGNGQVDSNDSSCQSQENRDRSCVCNLKAREDLDRLEDIDGIKENEYVSFDGRCPAYNTDQLIRSRVRELVELKEDFNLGGIQLNTVLIFNPDLSQNRRQQLGLDREKATKLLRAMADTGNGTFRDVNAREADDDFLEFNFTSVKADRTLTTMFARNDNAVATKKGVVPDSDGDGLSDKYERNNNLDEDKADTDGDGYADLFEKVLADQGFDPASKSAPAEPCSAKSDKDGEGLRACEEAELGTRPRQPDTDADGITDFLELIAGTEPLEEDAHDDVDFDGIKNLAEIRGGSDPLTADAEAYRSSKIRYEIEDRGIQEFEGGDVRRRCYRYDIREIPLTTTPIPRQRGLNRVFIRAGERASQLAGVSPEMRTACVEAFYNEGGVKRPEDGVVEFTQSALDETRRSLKKVRTELNKCSLLSGTSTTRGEVETMVENCMEPKIQVGNRLYEQETIFDMMQSHFNSDLDVRLPERPFEFFVPLPNFDPGADCYRPWEIEQVKSFMQEAAAQCRECASSSSSN